MAKHRLYLVGYTGKKPEDLHRRVTELGAVLVDARYRPFSRNARWNKSNLEQMFGASYMHLEAWGNLNYKSGFPIQIADYDAGLKVVLRLLKQKPVVLMCVCKNLSLCHIANLSYRLEDEEDVECIELGMDEEEQAYWDAEFAPEESAKPVQTVRSEYVTSDSRFFDKCIFDIVKSETLDKIVDAGGIGTITKKGNWKSAQKFLCEANAKEKVLPVFFDYAEEFGGIARAGIITDIRIIKTGKHTFVTEVDVENLVGSDEDFFGREELIVDSKNQEIDPGYKKGYLLCRTTKEVDAIFSSSPPLPPLIPTDVSLDPVSPIKEAEEGRERVRLHKTRERNQALVKQKKAEALQTSGCLVCQVCGFDFVETYGVLGKGFIECHHTVPVSQMVEGQKTQLKDLALVCANCHRMLHRETTVLSIEELQKALRT